MTDETTEQRHWPIELSHGQKANVSLVNGRVKLYVHDGAEEMTGVSVVLDEAETVALVDALTTAHDRNVPTVLDEPLAGENTCPNGCFLSLVARRYQERERCPHCGAEIEVVEQ